MVLPSSVVAPVDDSDDEEPSVEVDEDVLKAVVLIEPVVVTSEVVPSVDDDDVDGDVVDVVGS